MGILLWSIGCLAIGLCCHLVLWRVWLPKRQLRVLLLIFMVAFSFGMVLMIFAGCGADGVEPLVCGLYFALIYWSAALCYVITYSAMEGDSPTLSLTRYLHRSGDEGVPHEEIEEFFRQRPFVGARVKALITDNVLIEEQGGYRLSRGTYLFFRVILGYRRMVFGPVKSGG